MRLREISTGVIVHVDDTRGAAMVGPQWEFADQQTEPEQKAPEQATRRSRKTTS